MKAIEFSRAIIHINVTLKTNVSKTDYLSIIRVDVRSDQNSQVFITVCLVDAMFI
jgi:hypothetical protein